MKNALTYRWRSAAMLLAFAALQVGVDGRAAAPLEQQLPTVLRDIPQATGICRRDAAAPGAPLVAPEMPADLSCAVSVAALPKLLLANDTLLADMRLGADYQTFHIQGALQLGTGDLHSKPYWRGKHLILIGNGKAERELYSECTRLKRLGYQRVSVARGGMPLWLASEQPVVGNAPAASELAGLTPAELWLESQNLDNLVVLDPTQKLLQTQLPLAVVLPQTTLQSIQALIERRRKETRGAPLAAVVLVSAEQGSDQAMAQLQKTLLPIPLLVYRGSHDAVARQLKTQKAVWTAQARGPKLPACGM